MVDVRSVRLSICVGQPGVVTSSVTRDRLTQSARDTVVGHGLAVAMVTLASAIVLWCHSRHARTVNRSFKKSQYFIGHDVFGMRVKRNQYHGCNTNGVVDADQMCGPVWIMGDSPVRVYAHPPSYFGLSPSPALSHLALTTHFTSNSSSPPP